MSETMTLSTYTMRTISTKRTDIIDPVILKNKIAVVEFESRDWPIPPKSFWQLFTIRNKTQWEMLFCSSSLTSGAFCGGGSPKTLVPFSQGAVFVTDGVQIEGGCAWSLNLDGNKDHSFNVVLVSID